MSKPEIPASLRRAGITGVKHDLPDGFEVNFHADFCRIFKEDIQSLDRKRMAAAEAAELGHPESR
jgi:hypothetical protein